MENNAKFSNLSMKQKPMQMNSLRVQPTLISITHTATIIDNCPNSIYTSNVDDDDDGGTCGCWATQEICYDANVISSPITGSCPDYKLLALFFITCLTTGKIPTFVWKPTVSVVSRTFKRSCLMSYCSS